MKHEIAYAILAVFIGLSCSSSVAEETKKTHESHQHRHDRYAHMKNPVPVTLQSIAEGKKLYEKNCLSCHGESGKGGAGPDLSDAIWIHGNTDGEMFNVITGGAQGTAMRSFKKELSDEARWRLVNYLVSLRIRDTGGR